MLILFFSLGGERLVVRGTSSAEDVKMYSTSVLCVHSSSREMHSLIDLTSTQSYSPQGKPWKSWWSAVHLESNRIIIQHGNDDENDEDEDEQE